MALLGQAALAMWWNMAPELRTDFENWHTHEHFPERLGVPGFLRSTRWMCADGGDGVFVLYELESHAVLSSAAYLARLNAPTPWSTRLMPHHRNMVRSQNHVLESRGAAVARLVTTVRLSPAAGRSDALRAELKSRIDLLASMPGLSGAHLLQHQAPEIAQTTEQRIRGARDQSADWVLMVCGYDAGAIRALADDALSAATLERMGARADPVRGHYALAATATPRDVR